MVNRLNSWQRGLVLPMMYLPAGWFFRSKNFLSCFSLRSWPQLFVHDVCFQLIVTSIFEINYCRASFWYAPHVIVWRLWMSRECFTLRTFRNASFIFWLLLCTVLSHPLPYHSWLSSSLWGTSYIVTRYVVDSVTKKQKERQQKGKLHLLPLSLNFVLDERESAVTWYIVWTIWERKWWCF